MTDRRRQRFVFWGVQGILGTVLLAAAIRGWTSSESPIAPLPPKTRPKAPNPAAAAAAMIADAPAPPGGRTDSSLVLPASGGSPYSAQAFDTPVHHVREQYEVWELDPKELGWLLTNTRRALLEDLEAQPRTGGGVRLTSLASDSFLAARGVRTGDILRDINGFPMASPADLVSLVGNPANSRSLGLRLLLERDGQELTIDYRRQRAH
jgi:hypothetical protein